MIAKDVAYLGLLPAAEMVLGKDGRGLVERVSALIRDLMDSNLPLPLICERLEGDFGVDFGDLAGAFLGLQTTPEHFQKGGRN